MNVFYFRFEYSLLDLNLWEELFPILLLTAFFFAEPYDFKVKVLLFDFDLLLLLRLSFLLLFDSDFLAEATLPLETDDSLEAFNKLFYNWDAASFVEVYFSDCFACLDFLYLSKRAEDFSFKRFDL